MSELFDQKTWSRLAASMITRTLGLSRGKSLVIRTYAHTSRLAEILSTEAWKLGVQPVTLFTSEPSLGDGGDLNVPFRSALAPPESATIAACDGYIHIAASPQELQRRARLSVARHRALLKWEGEVHKILVRNSTPSVYLMAAAPTKQAADEYGVDLAAWTREGIRGSSVEPRTFQKIARPLARRLQHGRTVTLTHPNGTHLELGLVGREPYLDDGKVDTRDLAGGHIWTVLPAGLLVVAVDERVAEGRLVSNRPTRHIQGSVLDSEWTFRRGRLDHYKVGTGRAIFEQSYRRAGRGRDRPALLTIGVNPEIRELPRAEDQELGVVSVHIGRNADFGGRTGGLFRGTAILENADLLVDDVPVLRAGREV